MAPPLIALRDARLRIGQQQLFDGIDALLGRGDRVCLVGRNGSGKSTLLKVLGGLVELDGGDYVGDSSRRLRLPRPTTQLLESGKLNRLPRTECAW